MSTLDAVSSGPRPDLRGKMDYLYSTKAIDHFLHPRHVGTLSPPCGEGTATRKPAGPIIRIYVRLEDNRVTHARFLTQGCVAAIAAASWLSERVVGMAVDEALALVPNDVLAGLNGLPESRRFCARLAIDALHQAVDDANHALENQS